MKINILRIRKGQVIPWEHYLKADIEGVEEIERVAPEVVLVKEQCLPFTINCVFECEEDADRFCGQYSHRLKENLKKKSEPKQPKKEAVKSSFDHFIFV